MPYGKIAEEVNRKIKNGEIDPEEAQAFIRELDKYGICNPEKTGKLRVNLRERKVTVVER